MLCFKVRPVIRGVRNTEGGPFLMLRFQVCPFIRYVRIQRVDVCDVSRSALSLDMLEIQRWDHFLCYVTGSPCLLDMLEIQMADHFLCYVLRSAFSLGMFEIQRADHFLCYVLGSALSLDMLEIQRADHFLSNRSVILDILEIWRWDRFKVRPEIIFRTTDGGPFLILRFKVHAF